MSALIEFFSPINSPSSHDVRKGMGRGDLAAGERQLGISFSGKCVGRGRKTGDGMRSRRRLRFSLIVRRSLGLCGSAQLRNINWRICRPIDSDPFRLDDEARLIFTNNCPLEWGMVSINFDGLSVFTVQRLNPDGIMMCAWDDRRNIVV